MGSRTLIATLLFGVTTLPLLAQEVSYPTADSISYATYLRADWQGLINYGNSVIRSGTDFPILRQRIGYALFMQGKYGPALGQFNRVLRSDSHNQSVLYLASLCDRYLNRDVESTWYAARLEDSVRTTAKIVGTGITGVAVETSLKFPAVQLRGTGSYLRLGVDTRLANRITVEQSLASFTQSYRDIRNGQVDYFVKLGYPVWRNFAALGAYHFLSSSYLHTSFNNHMGMLGLRYSGTLLRLQQNTLFARLQNERVRQYDTQLGIYPLGNLDLYVTGKLTYMDLVRQNRLLTAAGIGKRISKRVWAETAATFGGLENFFDADGLYIYNSPDNTEYKAGGTAYIELTPKALLDINYTYERKSAVNPNMTYQQHSVSGGISWKF